MRAEPTVPVMVALVPWLDMGCCRMDVGGWLVEGRVVGGAGVP